MCKSIVKNLWSLISFESNPEKFNHLQMRNVSNYTHKKKENKVFYSLTYALFCFLTYRKCEVDFNKT